MLDFWQPYLLKNECHAIKYDVPWTPEVKENLPRPLFHPYLQVTYGSFSLVQLQATLCLAGDLKF